MAGNINELRRQHSEYSEALKATTVNSERAVLIEKINRTADLIRKYDKRASKLNRKIK